MKQLNIYALLCVLLIGACSKKEDFDGTRVDVRLAQYLEEYEAQLVGAEHGWLGYFFPRAGGAYTFRFVFSEDNRVRMQASLNAESAAQVEESSYRLSGTQVPSLFFDTYSYLHVLSDPNPNVAGGRAGHGLGGDFEFAILSVSPDSIRLRGNHNGSELLLIRAAPDQRENVSKAFTYNQEIHQLYSLPYYHNRLSIAATDYAITINTDRNTVNIYSDNDEFEAFSTTYATLSNGIIFNVPFEDGELVITEMTDFNIDLQTGITSVRAGDLEATITNERDPVVIDRTFARRLHTNPYSYSSNLGFTINGQADAFELGGVPGYVRAQYIPRRFVEGYDAFMIYFNGGTEAYTAAISTSIEDDGRMRFQYFTGIGSLPGGVHDLPIQQTIQQLVDPEGYYVYWTGTMSYDLVSVSDARRWIRFF